MKSFLMGLVTLSIIFLTIAFITFIMFISEKDTIQPQKDISNSISDQESTLLQMPVNLPQNPDPEEIVAVAKDITTPGNCHEAKPGGCDAGSVVVFPEKKFKEVLPNEMPYVIFLTGNKEIDQRMKVRASQRLFNDLKKR
jgi:hypothetical protein